MEKQNNYFNTGAFIARFLNNAIFIENRIVQIVTKNKLTINDVKILYATGYLLEKRENQIKYLSNYLFITPAACSLSVNKLIKNNYIYIKKDKIDRRNNYLYLSSKAVETINKINLYQLRLYNILIKKFDLEKVSSTIEVLKQLDEIMANSELE